MTTALPGVEDAVSPEASAQHLNEMHLGMHNPNSFRMPDTWQPGDPLYANAGNYVRSLYSVLDDERHASMRFHRLSAGSWWPPCPIVCHDCEVTWSVEDDARCFVCGEPGTSERRWDS
jgi:hypothetical protein